MTRKTCLDCGWSASDDDGGGDVDRRALEHFLETGHSIETIRRLPPTA